jgi:hypothetical protein
MNFTYGESLSSEMAELVSQTVNPNRGVTDSRNGLVKVSGSIPFELSVEGMGSIFKGISGKVTTTVNADNPDLYDHVFTRGKDLPSFTIEKGFTDINQYMVFNGCVYDNLKLSMAPGELAKASVDVVGQKVTTSSTPIQANPVQYVSFPYANFEAGLIEGATAPNLLNLSFELKNGVFSNEVVGSRHIHSIRPGLGELTGELSVEFEDLDYYSKWLNESEESLTITYATSVPEHAGKKIQIHLPRIKFNGSPAIAIADKQGIKMNLKFRALLDMDQTSPTYGTDFKITLTDSQATV